MQNRKNEEEKRKSRDQKFYDFFITLQKEYIVSEMRSKIYPDKWGKEKSQEIMQGKYDKVKDIALKNRLKTIFPELCINDISLYDEDLRVKLYHEIYGDGGLPNFIYRDKYQEDKLGYKDKMCYFRKGSEIKLPKGDVGILVKVDFDENLCYVRLLDDVVPISLEKVQRIL